MHACSFRSAYRRPIELAAAQHFLGLVLTFSLLDGGVMLRSCLFAVAAHWSVILLIMARRRSSPTRFDLGLIRAGFVPIAIVGGSIASLLGRDVM